MTPFLPDPARPGAGPELVAASLLTSAAGAELQLVSRDGQRVRLAADEATAREIAITLWRALDRND
jgi:hypothetical protein